MLLEKDGAVVSMTTFVSYEYPDEPVLIPLTVARALNVCTPAAILDGGENE